MGIQRFTNLTFIPTVLSLLCMTIITYDHAGAEQELFTTVYRQNLWPSSESRSGPGGELSHTGVIREMIPELCKEFNIRSILDVGCGDFNWFKKIDLSFLDHYLGIDIVPDLIAENNGKYASEKVRFRQANAITDPLDCADLILCRSVLPLLYNKDIFSLLKNIKKSGAAYLLITTYPTKINNWEMPKTLRTIIWARPINLEGPPFNFPEPLVIIFEGEPDAIAFDKSLALWRVIDIPDYA